MRPQAGLFSAVLTAFLVQSYPTISPDPSVALMGQVAVQTSSYIISNSFINATTTQIPSADDAGASALALRVNIL